MASKKFLNPINLVNLASDPSSPVEGDIYYNTTSDAVKVYANGAWASIGSGGAAAVDGLSDVTITGTPLDDQLLAYDTTSSQWINQSAAAAGLATPGDITTALSSYILSTAKGQVNGVASLDGSTLIPVEQIPSLSATYLTPAAGDLVYQPLDADLSAIAALTANGLLKKTSGVWAMDTSAYLTSYTETDPVFIASPAGSITSIQTGNWDTAYGWGNHASANYAASSHNHSLDSLSNVVITGTPSAGHVIIWDNPSAKWVNQLLVGLPAQSTHSGKFLTTDGSSASWSTIDLSSYLTSALASTTYLGITAASTTYAPKAEPTFTGTVVLPSTTSIGDVSATEISYLNNVTSAIQTQIDSKASSSHTHSYQDADSDLTAIAAITSGVGLLKRLGPDTWSIDTNAYITGSSPTISTSLIAGTSTFNLINSVATTVNFAGAATTLIIGSTDAGGSTTIRTPAIATTSTSLDLFNTTATTVNFGGAATTFNLGGTPTGSLTATLFGNATTTTKTINIGTGGVSGSETNINIGSSTGGATGTVSVYPSTNFVGTVTVPTPTSSGHATTKSYVDALAAGITVKSQVVYVSQTNLNATYANGTSDSSGGLGVGATLTGNVDGALILDGPEVEAGQRVLIKDQTNAIRNGIYVVTFAGDGDDPFILTRATDFNGNTSTNGIIKNGAYIFVTSGTTSANDSYVVSLGGTSTTPSGAIKIGTDNIVLAQYSGVPSNISTLGYVTTGTWAATPIDKDFIDTEIARTNDPVFTGHVTVPDPTDDTDATSKQYVDDLIFASLPYLPDIIPLDDLRYEFNGMDSRFIPKFQGEQVAINNPLRLLVTINGIIQTVDFPEYVWQSMLPREGFMVDNDGYIAFSEVVPVGSTFDARLMLGPNVNSIKKGYPFRAVDILLGA